MNSFRKNKAIIWLLIATLLLGSGITAPDTVQAAKKPKILKEKLSSKKLTVKTKVKETESKYGISNPQTDSEGVTTWDCVYFGSYWQNDTNGDSVADKKDEKEPIKWRVLSVDGSDAFLLADQVLDWQQWNDSQGGFHQFQTVTWKDTSLRTWLNQSFYQEAFSQDEQAAIKETTITNTGDSEYVLDGEDSVDKVYLLSKSEAENSDYGLPLEKVQGDNKRITGCTEYVKGLCSKDIKVDLNAWWLRTGGYYTDGDGDITYDLKQGISAEYISIVDYEGVRPVIHLDCSMDLWAKAPSVSMDCGIKKKIQYTINEVTGMFLEMNNGELYVEYEDNPTFRIWHGTDVAGFDRRGRLWAIELLVEEDKGLFLLGSYTWGETIPDIFSGSIVVENANDLVFDAQGYVTGYKNLSGEICPLPETIRKDGWWDLVEADEKGDDSSLMPPNNSTNDNNNTSITLADKTPVFPTPGVQTKVIDTPGGTVSAPPVRVQQFLTKKSGKEAVKLSWKKVKGAKGYQVQYALNKKFTKKKKSKLVKKSKNRITIKKLKKKTYYFRIRAYKLNGKKKVYGKWSKVRKVKL